MDRSSNMSAIVIVACLAWAGAAQTATSSARDQRLATKKPELPKSIIRQGAPADGYQESDTFRRSRTVTTAAAVRATGVIRGGSSESAAAASIVSATPAFAGAIGLPAIHTGGSSGSSGAASGSTASAVVHSGGSPSMGGGNPVLGPSPVASIVPAGSDGNLHLGDEGGSFVGHAIGRSGRHGGEGSHDD